MGRRSRQSWGNSFLSCLRYRYDCIVRLLICILNCLEIAVVFCFVEFLRPLNQTFSLFRDLGKFLPRKTVVLELPTWCIVNHVHLLLFVYIFLLCCSFESFPRRFGLL